MRHLIADFDAGPKSASRRSSADLPKPDWGSRRTDLVLTLLVLRTSIILWGFVTDGLKVRKPSRPRCGPRVSAREGAIRIWSLRRRDASERRAYRGPSGIRPP